jgi:hypothetical protein
MTVRTLHLDVVGSGRRPAVSLTNKAFATAPLVSGWGADAGFFDLTPDDRRGVFATKSPLSGHLAFDGRLALDANLTRDRR